MHLPGVAIATCRPLPRFDARESGDTLRLRERHLRRIEADSMDSLITA